MEEYRHCWMVAVDASRMAETAFVTAVALLNHDVPGEAVGTALSDLLRVIHIYDPTEKDVSAYKNPDQIRRKFEGLCDSAKRRYDTSGDRRRKLQFRVILEKMKERECITDAVVRVAGKYRADFLSIGAIGVGANGMKSPRGKSPRGTSGCARGGREAAEAVGSVADALTRKTIFTTVISKASGPDLSNPLDKIHYCIAVDGSDASLAVFNDACILCKDIDRMRVVHFSQGGSERATRIIDGYEKLMSERRIQGEVVLRSRNMRVSVADDILREVEESEADILCVGSEVMKKSQFALGSVCEDCVQRCRSHIMVSKQC